MAESSTFSRRQLERASRKLWAQYPTSAPSGKRMLLAIMQTGSVAAEQPALHGPPGCRKCRPSLPQLPACHRSWWAPPGFPSPCPHLICQLWCYKDPRLSSLLGKHDLGTPYGGLAASTIEHLLPSSRPGFHSSTTEKEPLLGQI